MRHYERASYRHLDDSERYRDYEYLADDAWVGANERVPELRQTFERDTTEVPRKDDRNERPSATVRSFTVRSFVWRIVRGLLPGRRPRK